MTVWVVRKSIGGETIGEPHLCATPGRIDRVPGLPTLDEEIAILLGDGEKVDDAGANGRLKILVGNQLAGFIELIEEARTPDVLLPFALRRSTGVR